MNDRTMRVATGGTRPLADVQAIGKQTFTPKLSRRETAQRLNGRLERLRHGLQRQRISEST